MSLIDLWPLADEVRLKLGAFSNTATQPVIDHSGLTFPGLIVAFPFFDPYPAPLAVEEIVRRNPYFTREAVEVRLASALEQGLITQAGDHYYLTDRANQVKQGIIDADTEGISQLTPLSANRLARLVDLLERITSASLEVAEPVDKSRLITGQRYYPGASSPDIVRVDHLISGLGAFRDDVHPAVWRTYGIDGPTWEAFTFVWREQATTPDTVAERVRGRRNPAGTYEAAFEDLVRRGWIEPATAGYRVTEKGRALREAAEVETDRIFYAPWSVLNAAEVGELRGILIELRDNPSHSSRKRVSRIVVAAQRQGP